MVFIILLLILSNLVWQSLIKENLYSSIFFLEKQITKIKIENSDLARKNKLLQIEVDGFVNPNFRVLESQARYNLGLIKEGEKYYQLPD